MNGHGFCVHGLQSVYIQDGELENKHIFENVIIRCKSRKLLLFLHAADFILFARMVTSSAVTLIVNDQHDCEYKQMFIADLRRSYD